VKRWLRPRITLSLAAAILVVILLGITLVQARSISRVSAQVASLREGLQEEVEQQNRVGLIVESNQRTVTRHLQEVRRLLNLSPGTYRFPETDQASESGTAGGNDSTSDDGAANERYRVDLFFAGIDRIAAEQELTTLETRLAGEVPAVLGPRLAEFSRELTLRDTGRLRWEISGDTGEPWVQIRAGTDGFSVSAAMGEDIRVENLPALATIVSERINEMDRRVTAFDTAREQIDELLNSPELTDALTSRSLLPGPRDEDDGTVIYSFVTDLTGDTAFTASVTRDPPLFSVDGSSVDTFDAFRDELRSRIADSDPRTAAQKATEASFQRIRDVGTSEPFEAFLTERDLTLSTEPRETLDFFLFDLERSDGTRFGAFAVQKGLGEIYLMDADEIVITRLDNAPGSPLEEARAVTDPVADTTLPEEFPPGFQARTADGTNIVLFGTHEEKADTIMLVHLSPQKTVSMISIPRDIWWQQRKLNYYHEIYGSDTLVTELSEMIAQPIDGWISVDMYAFIEIVDILGGIEVTLNEPLIDPTYRVRDDGQWSTLYYEAGTHHLTGIESLRLARSRHTSNDFERASRQQMILAALRTRLNELHAGNLDRVYELIETLSRYADSSYSVWELAQLYLGYRNAEITNRTGLTFDNVLYSTYSNVHLQGLDFDDLEDDFFRGEWILLPRQDDWDVIPWFVERNTR
jgi:LCP family protein required for cell wall assembly